MWTFLLAVVATTSLVAGIQWHTSSASISAGITFADEVFTRTPIVAAALGGPFSPEEIAAVRRAARREVEHAFAGLRVRVSDNPRAFWRVRVLPTVSLRRNRSQFSPAGASYGFGPLGGAGFVNFTAIAVSALGYAPPGTTRAEIVEAIGRGVGRSAVHEFAHMMVPDVPIDQERDEHTYEHRSSARAGQYYGELRWGPAWPVLHRRLGR